MPQRRRKVRKYSENAFVCVECFNDEGMKAFCEAHAESKECDFCGETGEEPIAAPLADVTDHINNTIHRFYDDPANAGLAYETAEGGYQGTTWDSLEIFEEMGLEFPRDKNFKLANAIANGLDSEIWSEAEPYALSPDQQLRFSWEQFCHIIKHQRRFFFLHEKKSKRNRVHNEEELYSASEILETIFSYAERSNAFVTLKKGTSLFRARLQAPGEIHATAGAIGPPPNEHAIKTNRMSPPGVVMTYVADDRDTALAETANKSGTFAIGEFVNDRELLILDLTQLPYSPSVFEELPDTMEEDPRLRLDFLHGVSREISRPIDRDDRVHVEYVPTQVVTEYIRTVIEIEGRQVDGIRYRSSRRSAGTALVLFADQRDLVFDVKAERPTFYRPDGRWLRLKKAITVKVTPKDIKRWSVKPLRLFRAT